MQKDSDRLIEQANFLEDIDGGGDVTLDLDNCARLLRDIAARLKKQEHLIIQMEAAFKSFNNRVMF